MNIGFVCGNVALEPEEVFNQKTGKKSARVVLAIDASYNDKDGNRVKKTLWESCMFRGKAAEVILEHVKKGGRNFAVMGSRNTYEHNGKYYSYINVEQFTLPIPAAWLKEREGAGAETTEQQPPAGLPGAPSDEDEIPF